jgi:hypothetical protein
VDDDRQLSEITCRLLVMTHDDVNAAPDDRDHDPDYGPGYDPDDDWLGWLGDEEDLASLEDLSAIPPLRRPEDMPPVRSQADLHRHWRALMGQLGFGERRIFLQLFLIDGTCTPVVLDITEIPDLPDPATADGLMRFCDLALRNFGESGMRVGLLYARPGSRRRTSTDLGWATLLTDAARRHGIPLHPIHLANDEELTVVSPDDLIRPA